MLSSPGNRNNILRNATAFLLATALIPYASAQSAITAAGFSEAWGTSNAAYDLNGDGVVNGADLSLFLASSSTSNAGTTGSTASTTPVNDDLTGLASLTIGSGFDGVTPTPPARLRPDGTSTTAVPMARWADVPFQVADGRVEVAIVAFHTEGIDRVEFSANGGPWVSVLAMTDSAHLKVPCYRTALELGGAPVGLCVEVRARIIPLVGQPMVLQNPPGGPTGVNGVFATNGLHAFFIHRKSATAPREVFVASSGIDANLGTNAAPVRTIARALELLRTTGGAEGGTATILEPGTYHAPANTPSVVNNSRWTTIRSAPNLTPGAVTIISEPVPGSSNPRGLIRTKWTRLRYEGVRFDMAAIRQIYLGSTQYVWLDRCILDDSNGPTMMYPDRLYSIRVTHLIGGSFATDSLVANQAYGFTGMSMVRGCHALRIAGDAYANTRAVLGCSLSHHLGSLTTTHSDIFQYTGPQRNNIVFKFRAWEVESAQNFYFDDYEGSEFRDCAFVDIAIENTQPSPNVPKSQLNNEFYNTLFLHVSAPRQYWVFRDDLLAPKTFKASGMVMRNCVLEWIRRASDSSTLLPPGVSVDHSHFCRASGAPTGPSASSITTGELTMSVLASNWSMLGASASQTESTGAFIPDLSLNTTTSRGPLPGGVSSDGGLLIVNGASAAHNDD
jgi:hypothetical protein